MNIIDAVEKEGMRTDIPQFNIGDTVKVFVKVVEGNRERLQGFEGVVIAAGIMIHMAVSVEDSVAMYEAEALNHTRKNYIIRMAA